jgi:hypothetical protein
VAARGRQFVHRRAVLSDGALDMLALKELARDRKNSTGEVNCGPDGFNQSEVNGIYNLSSG